MRKFCILAIVCSVSFAKAASLPLDYALFLTIATPLIVALIWYLAREAYWRAGGGIRFGVAYDGYSVPWDDWTRTQQELKTLVADGHIQSRVYLKLVPSGAVDTDCRRREFETRTGIGIIIKVTESPLVADKSKKGYQLEIHGRAKTKVDKSFLEATLKHTAHLMLKNASIGNTLSDILKYRAKGLYQSALLMAASIEYTEKRFSAAAAIVEVLERSLSESCGPTDYPRKNIRWLHVSCLTDQSIFPGSDPPKGDELVDIIKSCSRALQLYQVEFPFILLRQARNLFYADELDKALEYTLLYQSSGGSDTPTARLHIAVLYLFLGRWKEANVPFEHIVSNGELNHFDLNDLIGFAEYASDIGHDAAVYLQVLYRYARGDKTIPHELQSQFQQWLNCEDDGRTLLCRHIDHIQQSNQNQPKQHKMKDNSTSIKERKRKKKRK